MPSGWIENCNVNNEWMEWDEMVLRMIEFGEQEDTSMVVRREEEIGDGSKVRSKGEKREEYSEFHVICCRRTSMMPGRSVLR